VSGSPSAATVTTIPLSILRPIFGGGWPLGSRWTIPNAQTEHGAVEQPTGSVLSFRLRAGGGGRLRARVSLRGNGDARPTGVIRARVLTQGRDGSRTELWAGLLGSVHGRRGRSLEIDVSLPADEDPVDLLLCASHARPLERNRARLRWEDPRLEVTAEAEGEPSPAPAPEPSEVATVPTADLLISILTPVHNPAPQILREMLDSVLRQSFQGWELCLVDDGSSDPAVIEMLERASATDERVHLERHERAGGISAATNTALRAARGEYIALLDHDDVLADDALETVARTIAEQPDVDMIYSDEDVIEDGLRVALFRKPSWSPDLMRSHMYTCHLGVYRRTLANAVGGFRSEFDGSQDYDLVLRVTERTDRIVHIPRILYHWRSHEGSVAENLAAKPHAFAAARRAIAEHLDRTEVDGEVHFDAQRCWYRVDYPAAETSGLALVLPVPGADEALAEGLRRAVESWLKTPEPAWELVLAGPAGDLERCRAALSDTVAAERLRLVEVDAGVGRSAAINRAVAASTADRLILLESPVEPLTSGWLTRLASLSAQDGIAAVGAKTLARDGRVEHAGVVLREGLPAPVQLAADQIEPGPMAVLQVTVNFAAVTGTVAIGRADFERHGGLDERFERLAVADLCLRAWEQGLRVVSSPNVVVRRTESAPAVNDLTELAAFQAEWRRRLGPRDPYFGARAAAALTGVGTAG
jgi:GT2 family glycosyltransferase